MKLSAYSGFRIFKGEMLPVTLKRVLLEQLNLILVLSERFNDNPDYATHEIRKTTKRIRAIYRLYRNSMGEATYIRGWDLFGSLSNLLAEHRLSAVHLEILNGITRDAKNPVGEKLIHAMISTWQQQHLKLTEQLIDKQKIALQIKQIITNESERYNSAPTISSNYNEVVEGLKNTYNNGRKHLVILTGQPDTVN